MKLGMYLWALVFECDKSVRKGIELKGYKCYIKRPHVDSELYNFCLRLLKLYCNSELWQKLTVAIKAITCEEQNIYTVNTKLHTSLYYLKRGERVFIIKKVVDILN